MSAVVPIKWEKEDEEEEFRYLSGFGISGRRIWCVWPWKHKAEALTHTHVLPSLSLVKAETETN